MEPVWYYLWGELWGYMPASWHKYIMDRLSQYYPLIVTNVPGPAEPVQLAGCTVDEAAAVIPIPGALNGCGFAIFSYNGNLSVSLNIANQKYSGEMIMQTFEKVVERLLE